MEEIACCPKWRTTCAWRCKRYPCVSIIVESVRCYLGGWIMYMVCGLIRARYTHNVESHSQKSQNGKNTRVCLLVSGIYLILPGENTQNSTYPYLYLGTGTGIGTSTCAPVLLEFITLTSSFHMRSSFAQCTRVWSA